MFYRFSEYKFTTEDDPMPPCSNHAYTNTILRHQPIFLLPIPYQRGDPVSLTQQRPWKLLFLCCGQEVCREETLSSVSSHSCAVRLHSPILQTTWWPLLPLAMDILACHISSSEFLGGISGSLEVTLLSNRGARCGVRVLLRVLCLETPPGQLELTCHTANQSGPHTLLLDHKDPSLPGWLCLTGSDFSISSFSQPLTYTNIPRLG